MIPGWFLLSQGVLSDLKISYLSYLILPIQGGFEFSLSYFMVKCLSISYLKSSCVISGMCLRFCFTLSEGTFSDLKMSFYNLGCFCLKMSYLNNKSYFRSVFHYSTTCFLTIGYPILSKDIFLSSHPLFEHVYLIVRVGSWPLSRWSLLCMAHG